VALGLAAFALVFTISSRGGTDRSAGRTGSQHVQLLGGGKIEHVVVLYQENHSFDDVLGVLCVKLARCDGTRTGKLPDGSTVSLKREPDIVPGINHDVASQTLAIDGGKMDGFASIGGCMNGQLACYVQFPPAAIPNVAALARRFVISDRTFEDGPVPTWGSHMTLASANLDDFTGDNPAAIGAHPGPGWGCDGNKDVPWQPPGGGAPALEPACVPKPDGSGPYRSSPVQWVPTIMDRFESAGLSWEIDAPTADDPNGGYGRAVCPVFADCIYSSQAANLHPPEQVIGEAQSGTLPNLALVMPSEANSQHNGESMLQGDNWIGQVVNAIMTGPDWSSTVVFITWDDCGCFYDHVPPPAGLGVRVPMVIVSSWVKRRTTDSNVATFASMLAFTEHVFGLAPLAAADANAYDYAGSFTFAAPPDLARVPLVQHAIPSREQAWLRAHPPDPNDPT
jgi:phospholipase C